MKRTEFSRISASANVNAAREDSVIRSLSLNFVIPSAVLSCERSAYVLTRQDARETSA